MDTTRHVISEALYHLMVMLLTLGQGVQSMPVPTDVPMCTASEPAQYRLTFTGKWSQAAFPKQYPVYRPPAQWSNIVGKSTTNYILIGHVLETALSQPYTGKWRWRTREFPKKMAVICYLLWKMGWNMMIIRWLTRWAYSWHIFKMVQPPVTLALTPNALYEDTKMVALVASFCPVRTSGGVFSVFSVYVSVVS